MREAAVLAIGRLDGPTAEFYLRQGLDDGHPDVRDAANEMLAALEGR